MKKLVCSGCPYCWGLTLVDDTKGSYYHVWCGRSFYETGTFSEVKNNKCPHEKGE